MSARIPAFVAWSLAAACAVYWAMRLLIVPTGLPEAVQSVSVAGALQGEVAALFASPQAPSAPRAVTALASRFRLVGVMSPKTTGQTPTRDAERGRGQGLALIAVDGQPPRPYRVGAALDDALVLLAVTPRSALIGPAGGAAQLQLDVAPLAAAATGVRPPSAGLFPSVGLPRIAMPGLAPAPPMVERGGDAEPAAEGSPAPDAEPAPR